MLPDRNQVSSKPQVNQDCNDTPFHACSFGMQSKAQGACQTYVAHNRAAKTGGDKPLQNFNQRGISTSILN